MKWALFAAALLAGQAGAALPALADTPKDTLVIAKNIADIVSLDPAEAYEPSGGEILNNTYQRLFSYDPGDFTKLVIRASRPARIRQSAPICSRVRSPRYLRSCGSWPMEANGKMRVRGPISVWPTTTT